MTYKVCYWDDEAKEQKERDATPEEQAEIDARKYPIDPAIIKAQKWEEIKAYRTKILEGGFEYDGHWYHSDTKSQVEFNTLKLKALEQKIDAGDMDANIVIDGTNTQIKTIDNGYMTVTYNKILGIVAAGEVQSKRAYTAAATHQYYLNLSTDPANYDYKSSGWPTVYTGA